MKPETRHLRPDLAVIGTGLAGVSASIFALRHGLSVAQTGNTGAIAYTTGYLDLIGSLPGENLKRIADPWEAIEQLRRRKPPLHPLAKLNNHEIATALRLFTQFLSDTGLRYNPPGTHNIEALTPSGTIKTTLCLPATMANGAVALAERKRCLIVDFKGLRGFSGRQMTANLKHRWPELRTERISFPSLDQSDLYPEVAARTLEVPAHRTALAEKLRSLAGDSEVIGMPAVFGIHEPDRIMAELEQLVGLPLFEIPTMPPAVPGIRLRELVEQHFPQLGIDFIPQRKISAIEFRSDSIRLSLRDNFGSIVIDCKAAILATGRFISGGLEARMDRIIEPLFGLPVYQPESRENWYRNTYLDRQGHAINRSGLETDEHFRPLTGNGSPADERLFAAGIILAHQDWIRQRCGAGVAIATAYRAVEAAARLLQPALS